MQTDLYDNNNGKPITDIRTVKTDMLLYIDADRAQLRQSISKGQSQSVLQGVSVQTEANGKIIRYFDKRGHVYVRDKAANNILAYSVENGSIDKEFVVEELKKTRYICDFSINPKNGDFMAISNGGDLMYKSTNAARPDAFYRFTGRDKERFASLSVDWNAQLLSTVGTITIDNVIYQHIVYLYSISDTSNISLVVQSKVWQTEKSNSIDMIGHIYFDQIEASTFICCFTAATSLILVFKYDIAMHIIEKASLIQRLSNGKTCVVKQAFDQFYVCFNSPDIAIVKIKLLSI